MAGMRDYLVRVTVGVDVWVRELSTDAALDKAEDGVRSALMDDGWTIEGKWVVDTYKPGEAGVHEPQGEGTEDAMVAEDDGGVPGECCAAPV